MNPIAPKNFPSVAIAVPSGLSVHADFCMSLAAMCYNLNELPMLLVSAKSSIVADGRNIGVRAAQDGQAEYVLFLDSDMTFPKDTLLRLLMRDVDVIGATYSRRTPPLRPLGETLPQQPADAPAGLVEMSRMPTGCLLVRTSVFRRLREPYFRYRIDEDHGRIIGEDYDFCDRIRDLGIRIWCDPLLSKELGHIGQQVFTI
ncbi:hypothetical protein [uncultured Methylobacterium sp.]|jgi:glycosyltransferase involved in cell wall biosynthesis|uniref:glycosyltransferase family 2 protein n=1 Tax=uncultured Methylobacterium sp. TaxID=157278 RepID=UPI00261AAD5E|nr:hypothetical protein [uncultured Methylobacterium sp.]